MITVLNIPVQLVVVLTSLYFFNDENNTLPYLVFGLIAIYMMFWGLYKTSDPFRHMHLPLSDLDEKPTPLARKYFFALIAAWVLELSAYVMILYLYA
jgi:hypothetical protein